MARCFHATGAFCFFRYVMCAAQILLLFIYIIIETVLTIVTFILTVGQCYYHLRWRWYGRLKLLDSSNPLSLNTQNTHKGPRIKSPKSPPLLLIEMAKQKGNGTPQQRYNLSPQTDDDDDSLSDDAYVHRVIAADKDVQIEAITTHPPYLDDADPNLDDVVEIGFDTNITSRTSSSSLRSPRSKMIKILTQNLWVHYLAPAPNKRLRLEAFIQFLRSHHDEYDILIIQEIFGLRFGCFIRCNELEYLVQSLYKMGYHHYTKPSGNLPWFGQNGGIMLFSKYPLHFDDVFKFNQSDELMLRKGFAIAITHIPLRKEHDGTNGKSNGAVTGNEDCDYYPLCIGTGHCDPYRPKVILSQIEQFSQSVRKQSEDYQVQKGTKLHVIVGGDFNTRNSALVQGLHDHFEDEMSMYNCWTLKGEDRTKWDLQHVTYRSAYLPKWRTWCALCSCGWIKLPTLHEVTGKYLKGYCLDHLLTNIDKNLVEDVRAVDTRYKDVFVSDHLGVELLLKIPIDEDVVYQV